MDEEELAKKKGGRIVRLFEGQKVGLSMFQYEDILFGAFVLRFINPAQQLRSIKELKHRPDDVLLCTYPKSGTHWMVNLLNVMLSDRPANEVKAIDVPNIELSQIDKFEQRRSPRIFHSHLRFERLPLEHVKNGGKIILTLRNPKDVIVSMFHHSIRDVGINSKLSWEYFFKYNMAGKLFFGSYFDYLRHWDHVIRTNTELNILVVYYEDLIKNPSDVVRIRDFLGLEMNDVQIKQVIARCTIEQLRNNANTGKTKMLSVDADKKPVIYRKGVIGDWMNHFTVAQNAEIDELIRDKLSDTMFKFDYYPTLSKSKI